MAKPNSSKSFESEVRIAAETRFDAGELGSAPPVGEIAAVWLNSLTATPGSLFPFQAATIAWDVHAEAGRVRIELNGELVGLSGSRIVTPQSSSVYRIVAKTPNMARELGRVSVNVDSRACTTYQPLNVLNVLNGAWERGLEQGESFSLTRTPTASFADGRVHLRADFSFDMHPLPGTGTGKIRASFGIGVADRQLVTSSEAIDVDLRLPLWARLIPQTAPRLGLARIQATQDVRSAIRALLQLIGFLGAASDGSALVSARIVADAATGVERLSFTACPDEPLQRLVGSGETAQATMEPRIATKKPNATPRR